MLELLLGAAGTGKTRLLFEKMRARVENGGKAILLVPEQASFESEKALYRLLGPQLALSVEVLSFTRLCDRIFREYGGLAGVHMDETAKYLLMSVALEELGGQLTVYKKNRASAAFVAAMCETVGELKTAGALPEDVQRLAGESEGALRGKLADIALIFSAYQAMVERGYSDPDDALARAGKRLEGRAFFAGYEVFIDGFMSFMGAEWRLLGSILAGSPRVVAAFCCDGISAREQGNAFSAAIESARRMVELARQNGVAVAAPTVLREPRRFANPALAHLALEFPRLRPEPCAAPAQAVELTACEDVYDELEFVAAKIVALVRDGGCRYREIAVIGRTLDRYLVPLQTVFAQYDIPFFTDLRADIQVYPLVSGLLCALDAARSGFDSEYLLSLAKNCISGVTALEAGALENYCYIWGVEKSAWTTEFVNNPDGMGEAPTPEQLLRLEKLNEVRRRLVQPLERLRRALEACDGRGFAAAAFAWLEQSGASRNLQEYAAGMEPGEEKAFLALGAQIWDTLVGILEVFGGALGGATLSAARCIDLLRMCAGAADVGVLPQTLDQVIVGAADRVRPNEPKAVFVIGLNEGEFPQWTISPGIFSAGERDRLREQGLDLLRTPERYALFERYFVYFALTRASERLYLSWPLRDGAGVRLAPSTAVEQVARTLGLSVGSAQARTLLERVGGESTAYDLLTRNWRTPGADREALARYFFRRAPEKLAALEQCAGRREFSLSDGVLARALFGDQMRISPSRAERYYSCAFSYFCQSGLRLLPRRRVEFNPIESGSLIHLVLEKLVKKYGGRGLSTVTDAALKAEISALIQEELTSKIADFDAMSARFKYLFRRLVNTLLRLLRRLAEEFSQSAYEPVAFELPIGEKERVKPLELRAPDGTRVIVEGVIDRVDLLEKNGKRYVRVVDYKSGQKAFNLADVYYGLNMQMLIYLFTLCENGENTLPAGVLYLPARDSVISAGRNASGEEVRAEQQKRLRMNGLLLEDRDSLSAMEPELGGVFIPAKTKKDGTFDAHSSLANLAQMGAIRRQVEALLTDIAEKLHGGQISAAPVQGLAGYSPCDWCDYHTVCAHEDGDAVRALADMDKNEALKAMEGGDENG